MDIVLKVVPLILLFGALCYRHRNYIFGHTDADPERERARRKAAHQKLWARRKPWEEER